MRNLIFCLAAVLPLWTASAAEPRKRPAPPAKAAGQKAGGTEAKPPAAEEALKNEVIAGLKNWDARLETLRARFTQEVDFSEAGIKQRVEGTLDYMKPDLLKIEHLKPARQLIYTDKRDLWVYKPEDSQAVRTNWASWKKSQSGNFSGIMEFGGYSALLERNELRVSRDKTAPYYLRAVLTPKKDPALYTLTLALSSTDYFPAEASFKVDGTVIRTTLEDPERNVGLDKELFRFTPPKGTEIIEFKD